MEKIIFAIIGAVVGFIFIIQYNGYLKDEYNCEYGTKTKVSATVVGLLVGFVASLIIHPVTFIVLSLIVLYCQYKSDYDAWIYVSVALAMGMAYSVAKVWDSTQHISKLMLLLIALPVGAAIYGAIKIRLPETKPKLERKVLIEKFGGLNLVLVPVAAIVIIAAILL